MSPAALLLFVLALVTAAMAAAFLIPRPQLNEPAFDPWNPEDPEHVGRHRAPESFGRPVPAGDSLIR